MSETGRIGLHPVAPGQASAIASAAGGPGAIYALYRVSPADDWRDCEIIAQRSDGLVLREVGKLLPGVWVCPADMVVNLTSISRRQAQEIFGWEAP